MKKNLIKTDYVCVKIFKYAEIVGFKQKVLAFLNDNIEDEEIS